MLGQQKPNHANVVNLKEVYSCSDRVVIVWIYFTPNLDK